MKCDRKQRIKLLIERMPRLFYTPLETIELSGAVTTDHLNLDEARSLSFEPMPPGTRWGKKWDYAWFKAEVTLPESSKGKRIDFCPGTGIDSAIYINGNATGARDYCHREVTLSRKATPGATFEIMIETYAGHGYRAICGGGPLPYDEEFIPADHSPKAVEPSSVGIWHEPLFQLWMDCMTLEKLSESLPDTLLRYQEINQALYEMTLVFDLELPHSEMLKTVAEARAILKPVLECHNGSTAPTYYCFGHSHLDVAWCWPLRETESKATRTFGTQLALMNEYKEMTYLQSQPHLYWMVKNKHPKLYARIKKAVKQGRWIPEGGMWVEPDANMTGGESLIRQCVHGKRFFRDEFNIQSRLLWMPDVFGCTASLPQIMKGCELDYFSSHKMFWGVGRRETFPYQSFWWRGIDGTEIFAHLHNQYNSEVDPHTLVDKWNTRQKQEGLTSRLVPYGWGDGGGGPTREHLEYLRRQQDLEGSPRCKNSHPLDFFHGEEEKQTDWMPTYVGELYLQTHQGTYTTQAATKKGNRQSEFALREAEMWTVAAANSAQTPYPLATFDSLWKKVLLNQFHDILPGSSIARVHEEAEADYAHVISSCKTIIDESTGSLISSEKETVTVFNSLSWQRNAMIVLPDGFTGASTDDGEVLPVQTIDGRTCVQVAEIPSCGWQPLRNSKPVKVQNELKVSQKSLENSLLRISINAKGELTSIFDKELGLELADAPCNQFMLFKDVPYSFDAWNIDAPYKDCPVPLNGKATITVKDRGPLVASVVVERPLHNSTLRQEIRLSAKSRRIEFETWIDWQERHKLLKVGFPVTIVTDEALHEIQFGHIARPNHASTDQDAAKYEVCQQKWTALCENSHGVALLNDCKYGIGVDDNTMHLTLLKSPLAPAARADIGSNHFTYAFYAWKGSFAESDVIQEGYALNAPVTVASGHTAANSLLRVDQPNIIIESVKAAEDGSGDIVLRLYESKRMHTRCVLSTTLPVTKASETNMLEEKGSALDLKKGDLELTFRPFEIKTVRMKVRAK